MSQFSIRLHDKGRCQIRHELADAEIITDLPPEYGGHGRSFSSTDLVTAALGSCLLTSMESILAREGFNPAKIEIKVKKALSQNPKMIKSIRLAISYPEKLSGVLIKKLKHATAACPVKRSLNEQVDIQIHFLTG